MKPNIPELKPFGTHFVHEENQHNFELFTGLFSKDVSGIYICQALPEERTRIFRLLENEPVMKRIHKIDLAEASCDTVKLQEAVVKVHESKKNGEHIFFIYNIEGFIYHSKQADKDFYQKLNLIRDFFMRYDSIFVFFMAEASVQKLMRYAFDFYDWVQLTFTFVSENPYLFWQDFEPGRATGVDYSNTKDKIEYLKSSLPKSTNKKDRALRLFELGQLYSHIYEYSNAVCYLTKCLEIQEEMGDKQGEAVTLEHLGGVRFIHADYDTAHDLFESALKKYKEIGERKGEGVVLNRIGHIFHARGDFEGALVHFEKALDIFREIRDKSGEGKTLSDIGEAYFLGGDYERALPVLEQSLSISRLVDDKVTILGSLSGIAHISLQKQDIEKFLQFETEAYSIAIQIDDTYKISYIGYVLGEVLCQIGQPDEGLPMLKKSLEFAKKLRLRSVDLLEKLVKKYNGER